MRLTIRCQSSPAVASLAWQPVAGKDARPLIAWSRGHNSYSLLPALRPFLRHDRLAHALESMEPAIWGRVMLLHRRFRAVDAVDRPLSWGGMALPSLWTRLAADCFNFFRGSSLREPLGTVQVDSGATSWRKGCCGALRFNNFRRFLVPPSPTPRCTLESGFSRRQTWLAADSACPGRRMTLQCRCPS